MLKSTLLQTRTDSHLFSPPNVDQSGGGREAFSRDNSGCKSRFIASLAKIYTNIALTGFPQV